ncbi:MAG: methylmalonyl-CoA epimerase [Candidatus Marinimicrobia bacterium]|nr:methylmalonyl-CoA epimerase [Candidatus Neomarinimicrobiota bacterium]
MKIKRIEHIGIAVKSLENDAPFWKHVLNISHRGTEIVEREGVTTDIYDTGSGKVELLESLRDDSPIAAFIDKRGAGVHHICFEVENIYDAITELIDAGIEVIYKEPRKGAEGFLVTFIHPKSTGGVLVELAQKPD